MSRQSEVRVRVSKCALRLTLVLSVLCGAAFAWSQQWPPISEAEKAVDQCPGQPGAPAVYLYREHTSNHIYWTVSSFARLKILTPAGKEYGTIEIPFSDVWKVEDIRARVLQPDGRIVRGDEVGLDLAAHADGGCHVVRKDGPDGEARRRVLQVVQVSDLLSC